MKSLTNKTLAMAVAMTLWATSSMAGEMSALPMSSSEKGTISATAPFHALSGLDAQTLSEQAMTDQELQAVEGGTILQTMLAPLRYFSTTMEMENQGQMQALQAFSQVLTGL